MISIISPIIGIPPNEGRNALATISVIPPPMATIPKMSNIMAAAVIAPARPKNPYGGYGGLGGPYCPGYGAEGPCCPGNGCCGGWTSLRYCG